jgi:hypothetical protein
MTDTKVRSVDLKKQESFDILKDIIETVGEVAGLNLPKIQITPSASRKYKDIFLEPCLYLEDDGRKTPLAILTFSPFVFQNWDSEEGKDNFLKHIIRVAARLDEFVSFDPYLFDVNYHPPYFRKKAGEMGLLVEGEGRKLTIGVDTENEAFCLVKSAVKELTEKLPTTPLAPKPRAERQKIQKEVKKIWIRFACSRCGIVVEYGPCPPDYRGLIKDPECPHCGEIFTKSKISKKTFVKKREAV